MSGAIEKHINGVDYEFTIHTGTVAAIVPQTGTRVWEADGSGYADPHFGGMTEGSAEALESDHWREITVSGDNGATHLVVLPDAIAVTAGDRVSLFYGKAQRLGVAQVHGFKNHANQRWWTFGCQNLVKPEFRRGPEALGFRFFRRGLVSFAAGLLVASAAMTVAGAPALLSDPLALIGALPAVFEAMWLQILALTTLAWAVTRIAYRLEVKSAAQKASQAMLGMAAYAMDKRVRDEDGLRLAA